MKKNQSGWVEQYHFGLFLFIQALIFGVITVSERFSFEKTGFPLAILDGIRCFMNYNLFIICYIIYSIYLVYMIKESFDIQRVVRYSSRMAMWRRQICILFGINILTTLLWMIEGLLNGRIYSNVWINWTNGDSYFAYTTRPQGETTDVGLLTVLIVSFLIVMFMLDMISLILLLSYWFLGNLILGMIFVVGTGIFDAWGGRGIFFLKQFNVYANEWTNTRTLMENVLSIAILTLCITLAGMLLADKKEFLGANEEKK